MARITEIAKSVVALRVALGMANVVTLVIQGFSILGMTVNDFAKVSLHVYDKRALVMSRYHLTLNT